MPHLRYNLFSMGYYIATQYDKTEYGTLEYSIKYGLVDISIGSQIWSYHYSIGGCLNVWQCISFNKATNTLTPLPVVMQTFLYMPVKIKFLMLQHI